MERDLPITGIVSEFLSLKTSLTRLEGNAETEADWETAAELLRDRMAELTHSLMTAEAHTSADLMRKAVVLLDWIDPSRDDVPTLLAVSVCRDILRLFPIADFL